MKTGRFINNAFFYICVFISCAPLILLLILTVSASWPYPSLLPKEVSLEYYRFAFHNIQTLKAVTTSIILAVSVTLLTLIIAVPAAKALAHYDFWGKGFVKLMVLVPLVLPVIAVTIGIQVSMIKLGLASSFIGVALIHAVFALPYAIRIMTSVFEIVGDEHEQQAAVLGAGAVFIFTRVTLPQIMPGILSAATLCFTISLGQYITTFLIGGGRVITVTMLLIPYIQSGQVQTAAVYSTVLIAASMLSLYFMEHVVRRRYSLENVFYI